VKTVLPGKMLVVDSSIVVFAYSIGSAVVGVTALEHSASASRIAVGVSKTGGATSAMTSTAGSSAGVRRTG
jgi:hypothetical protein